MLRASLLLLAGTTHAAVHHGCYTDPNHYLGSSSFAGTRFIAEGMEHDLTIVGSDNGEDWWVVRGNCTTPAMDQLYFDFSSKGGPPDLHGVAIDFANGTSIIRWDDGNVWNHADAPAELPDLARRVFKSEKQPRLSPADVSL
jgi:hypothetical protein